MNNPEQRTHEDAPQELSLPGMPADSVRPASSPRRVVRRKAILSDEDDKVEHLDAPERSSVTYTVQQQGGPGANQRRYQHTLKLILVVVLANNLLIAVAGVWFVYFTIGDIESRLQGPTPQHPAAASKAATATDNAEAVAKQTSALEAKFNQQIADLRKQLAESSLRDEGSVKQQHDATEQKLDQITRRVAALASQVQDRSPVPGAPSVTPAPALATESQNVTDLPPAQAELVLLKERNRLTAYADEAIATGSREPYEQLWKSLTDPRLANLVHAARAEILRVQECYLSGQRAKYYGIQQYQIPIADIFPDAASLPPAQLSDDQFIQILGDKKVPWQARVKAAWYLGRRRTTKVGDALVKAAKEDPMLDVEAEATFSFEQVTGYRSKLFEPENLEAWWKSYKSAPPENNPSKPKEKSGGDKPAKSDAKEPPLPTEEGKPEKPQDEKDKDAKETKPAPLEKKSLKSSDEKSDKKEPKKKPVIPLREPEDKP